VAQEWGKTWYPTEKSTNEFLNKELESKYKTTDEKLKKLTRIQKEISDNSIKFIKQVLSYPMKNKHSLIKA